MPTHPTQTPAFLPVKPFAAESGLAERRVRQLLAENRLRHIRCGKRYMILATELTEFAEREAQPVRLNGDGADSN